MASSIQVQRTGQLKTVQATPGQCYDYLDELTHDRSHSFAFRLDQTRRVSIDIANQLQPKWLGQWFGYQNIQVVLWSAWGEQQELFSVAPGDRDREIITLNAGRYLLELKTETDQKIDYSLKLTAMKWLMLECVSV
ncbi:MAG: hypothetical protein MUF72_09745 [Elainella sp. Prado103]|nr:hypothetical protein [Elainella sp. Prado103]